MEPLDSAQPILNNSGALDAGVSQYNAFADLSGIGSSSSPQMGQESLPVVGPGLVPVNSTSLPLSSTEMLLVKAKAQATTLLSQLIDTPALLADLHKAFGEGWNPSDAEALVKDLAGGSDWPTLVVLEGVVLNANGAFSQQTNTIYLSQEFLSRNANNLDAVTSVLLEEVGHYIDSKLNATDSPGDEGEIFSAIVQGQILDARSLSVLQAEDDHHTLILNGQNLEIEESSITGGSGNDILIGGAGNDQLSGEDGDDTINAGLGRDNVDGGAGNDLLIVDYSNSALGMSGAAYGNGSSYYTAYNASGYNDISFFNIERFEITGTGGNDNIQTGAGNDNIIGGAGNDNITVQGGDDTITGGDGNDTIDGGTGNDTIDVGAGNDIITGGSGINVIDGGDGIDTLTSGDFSSLTSNITFDNSDTSKTIILADGSSVTSIERFINVTTGSGDDVISFKSLSE
jgi:Ca2+-binding RTX toxin-like protein